jgi:uncharacterized protein YdaU (DUF1376 family)
VTSAPYMRLYIGDYHADTTHLTGKEHGPYLLLLMAMYRAGGKLPADDAKLARIAKISLKEWLAMRDIILAFFTRRGGSLSHKRVTKELSNYRDSFVRQSEGGRKGGLQTAKKNKELGSRVAKGSLKQSKSTSEGRTEPLLGSGSTLDASEPARLDGAVSSRPTLTVVPKAAPKPVRPETAAERRAEIAAILAKPKPDAPPPPPAETQAQMVERLRKSIVPGGAA